MKQVTNLDELPDPAFRQRLGTVVRSFHSRRQAAEAAGVSVDALTRYLKGNNQPPFAAIVRLAKEANVSLDWLAGGEGAPPSIEDGSFRLPALSECTPEGEMLPAGIGHCTANLSVSRNWLCHALQTDPYRLAVCTVVDESMSPGLNPGDLVIVERGDAHPAGDGIYAITMNGAFLIKRLQIRPDGRLAFHSDHPAYQSFEIDREQLPGSGLYIHGHVIWCGRRLP